MEQINDTGECSSKLPVRLEKDEVFRHTVAKAFYKDTLYGTALMSDCNISLKELNDCLDDSPELGKKFNEDVLSFACGRIERNVNCAIAHLTEKIGKNEDDINALRIIQSAIQTLSTVKRAYETGSSKSSRKMSEFEDALHKLGM